MPLSIMRYVKLLIVFCVLVCSRGLLAEPPKVGIMAALPEELDSLMHQIESVQKEFIGGAAYLHGKLDGVPVVAMLSGMGKVNAASSAQKLISDHHVKVVLFTGVAGSLNSRFEIGDVVVPEYAFQHDVGWLSAEKFFLHPPGALPEIGIGTGKEPVFQSLFQTWSSEGKVLQIKSVFKVGFQSIVKSFEPISPETQSRPRMHVGGSIATGDQFIASGPKKKEIASMGADLVDMEGAAVAQVCQKNGASCLIIRSVSDKADSGASTDFSKFLPVVAKNNQSVVKFLLSNHRFKAYL